MTASTTIRPLADSDSLEALTTLLHRAYAPLGAAGMNFTAVDQSVEVTRERVQRGPCFVAEQGGALVGTATVNGMFDPNRQGFARVSPWFFRRDVAHVQQYAVDPECQGLGIGAKLRAACEDWARTHGHHAIALDTAMPATHLRERYRRAGFAEVAQLQRDGKHYRSVIMVKPLAGVTVAPHDDDAEHHAALVRTLWASFEARDWAGARALFADDAHLYWIASGEHLDDADAIIRVNAIYPEGWAIHVHEVTPMADGRVHSLVQVNHGDGRFFAHSLWRFAAGRIVDVHETWGQFEAPPAWRTAEAIGAYRREGGA
ncbi:GNAT family N-acetyltransferase [Aquincola sp. S2]|uniref:GNAT family N-acetyltransferase n=1 Tax=Pseudaquabacterium terrae TaxID=2732868 RepID=A0ABX2EAD1_9BURK|nr:GNAT family N-acetyltransferase [Aquabacterium terrae]NRF66019.1 GNAT family N-acetyltransferase [Aquabacterium terrae]